MSTNKVIHVALPVPLRRNFDYLVPNNISITENHIGCRVQVPFGKRQLVGVIININQNASVEMSKLRNVSILLDETPCISLEILTLCQWASNYYHHSLGEIITIAMPQFMRKGKPIALPEEYVWKLTNVGKTLQSDDLKKVKRQIELLELLQSNQQGLTHSALKNDGFSNIIIKTCHEKGWIEKITQTVSLQESNQPLINQTPPILNLDQKTAVEAILKSQSAFQVFLLHGITGSGKTEVYLQAIHAVLKANKQVLVLVPEIGLTPQTIERFAKRFNVPLIVLHSALSDKQRFIAWRQTTEPKPQIVIGTRSAIFSSLPNLGIIIIDEEHDSSFKQQESPRYHARDLSIIRAQQKNIPIVLGSATPALETLKNAKLNRYQYLWLPERAGKAIQPKYSIVDVRNLPMRQGISQPLVEEMKHHLAQGNQVILFLNRRGYAPVLMCHACGWTADCPDCDARLTYHRGINRLHCHHCNFQQHSYQACSKCGASDLNMLGLGTERVEETLNDLFPHMNVVRIDRDNTQRKGSLDILLESIHTGEARILLGTQMLAKGHHFPNVTLVAILDIDSGFFSPDFRALERTGQLILQVAGRAGRAEKPGKVMLQTHHPDHPLLQTLIHEGYKAFANTILSEREKTQLPPYSSMILFRAEGNEMHKTMFFLQELKKAIQSSNISEIRSLGPASAPMMRKAGKFRAQLLLSCQHRIQLQKLLQSLIPKVEQLPSSNTIRWSLDVDPLEMF